MTGTLLLRLCGPLQSYGTQSRFNHRDGGREPSKSAVIGLLCAALGKPREEHAGDGFPSLAELVRLRMGVRVDQAGSVMVDYHTAQSVMKADGGVKACVLSWRQYIADACFLVGLEGPVTLLERLNAALRTPRWQLSLGRKSCVPALPLCLPEQSPEGPGLQPYPLEAALKNVALLRRSHIHTKVRLVLELPENSAEGHLRLDNPLCFASRRFGVRLVSVEYTDPEVYPACISPDLS